MDEVVGEFRIHVIAHLAFEALTDDIMANCSHIHVEMTIIVSTVTYDAVYLAWAQIHVGREVSFADLLDQCCCNNIDCC